MAEAASQAQPTVQADRLKDEKPQNKKTNSAHRPEVESKDAATSEPAASPVHLPDTQSPESQPTSRTGGMMQSRWASAPDKPVVDQNIQSMKDEQSLEQRGNTVAGKDKKARNSNSRRKENTKRGKSSSDRPARSPKTSIQEAVKQPKAKASKPRTKKAQEPSTVVHTPTKSGGMSTSKSARMPEEMANDQPAKDPTAGIGHKTDDIAQSPGSSLRKNEISLSMWA